MKVFKFYQGNIFYAYAASDQSEAYDQFEEEFGGQYTELEEIPESEWDKKIISMWDDNDQSKKPTKISIREAICGTEPHMIYSNDSGLI
jgi:hypothetical protein